MTARNARLRGARGAAAVEFAILLPVLMLVCLGAIEWGFHFFRREIIVNAAREGARAGSVADADTAAVAQARALAYLATAGLDGATCTVTVTQPPPGSVRVSVDCPGGSFTVLFSEFMPARIVAAAEMRHE